jgi:arylsulfatase I/J
MLGGAMLGLAALGAEPLLHSPRESSRRGARELLPHSTHTKERATRPHLIVTLVDDVGYNDVGWRNGDVKTPFLDSLLRSESEPTVELLRHYAFCVCSPTRASLLTGRLPAHVNQMNIGAEFPSTDGLVGGMDLRMRTLPQLLGEAGYSTAHVGKWHLGASQMAQLPSRRGFHESFAFMGGFMNTHLTHLIWDKHAPTCNDTSKPGIDLWENETPVYAHGGVHSCELFATRAVHMIARHDLAKPLFMYVALAEAHGTYDEVPRHSAAATSCSEDTEGCVTLRHYRGMIACADEATRNITEALQRQDMWKDTLMVWSSDNGGKRGDMEARRTAFRETNAPFRGYKKQMLEGGVRVVALLAGGALPATAPPKFEGMVHVADWFATFAALAGIDDPSDPGAVQHGLPDIDSINMWPALTGENSKGRGRNSGRTELLLGAPSATTFCEHAALIQGDWKIVSRKALDRVGNEDPADLNQQLSPGGELRAGAHPCVSAENFALFNLTEDPYEEHPYLYDTGDTTRLTGTRAIRLGHADKLEELVGRLRELAADAHQTGVSDTYVHPHNVLNKPLANACSVAQAQPPRADAAPDADWHLELAAPGTRLQCSAGRRGATEEECLAAVREAASREGLEVEVGLKSVKVGAAGFVPAGCSYSIHSKMAMFNTNPDGGDRAGSYRLACRGTAPPVDEVTWPQYRYSLGIVQGGQG